jgi:hypothetical protein
MEDKGFSGFAGAAQFRPTQAMNSVPLGGQRGCDTPIANHVGDAENYEDGLA